MNHYMVTAAFFSVKQKEGRCVEQRTRPPTDTKNPAGGVVAASILRQEFIRK